LPPAIDRCPHPDFASRAAARKLLACTAEHSAPNDALANTDRRSVLAPWHAGKDRRDAIATNRRSQPLPARRAEIHQPRATPWEKAASSCHRPVRAKPIRGTPMRQSVAKVLAYPDLPHRASAIVDSHGCRRGCDFCPVRATKPLGNMIPGALPRADECQPFGLETRAAANVPSSKGTSGEACEIPPFWTEYNEQAQGAAVAPRQLIVGRVPTLRHTRR
jgi:hypothetical protein